MSNPNVNEDEPCCIHQSFHKQALATPNNVCLIDAVTGKSLSYAETQRQVLALASELKEHIRKQKENNEHAKQNADTVVAVYMEPSPDYVIAMLAILSAGAAYVPLELAYPVSMLQRVLADCHPSAIITSVEHKAGLPNTDDRKTMAVIAVDDNKHELMHNKKSLEELLNNYNASTWEHPTLDDLAFIVYSSGTTGQPKGIANPHRAPAYSYRWRFDEIDNCSSYEGNNIVACNVFFVWECLRPVMVGAAVLPVPANIIFDGEQLSHLIQNYKVTEMLFTPSLLENLLNTVSVEHLQERLNTLNTVYLNGEVVSMKLRRRCLQLFPNDTCNFINLYSISECHEVGAIDLREIDETLSTKFCPIGLPTTDVHILDEMTAEPVANKEDAGELYVAGHMLARGYLGLPEMTAKRFVQVELNGKSQRMYRSGDRARLLPNGQLEILGRCDFMVKIRGYSIVLGAVEAALMETVDLAACVVVADDGDAGKNGDDDGDRHLVAYVVRSTDGGNSSDDDSENANNKLSGFTIDPRTGACPEIRRAVAGSLPHYMIPSVYIELETLPVKEVGAKLDRKALETQSADRRAMLRSLQLSSATHTTDPNSAAQEESQQAHEEGLSQTVAKRWKRMAKYLRVPKDAPFADIEETVTALWEVALDREIGTLGPQSDFHEEGGHSLSAARLVALINKVFPGGVQLTAVQLFRDSATVNSIAKLIASSCDGGDGNNNGETMSQESTPTQDSTGDKSWAVVDSMESADHASEEILAQVRADAVLPEDMGPIARTSNATSLQEATNILLTGVTGFLGSHILQEILEKNSSATVHCLVRKASPQTLDQLAEKFGVKISDKSRVVLVKGDLSSPQLGLSADSWGQLVSTVDMVVHCGAAVSLTASYAKLQPANVAGTLSIIRLACSCRPGTSLVYVSSNGIFPTGKGSAEVFFESDDTGCLPDSLGSSDGYGLSKWAADRLVTMANSLGLPTMTIRFGNLGWQSATGVGNPLDYQAMMLSGCRRLGSFPKFSGGWLLETTPIDFASRALVALASNSSVLENGSIFHCVQDGFTEAEQVRQWMCNVDGSSCNSVPFPKWKKIVEARVAEGCDDSNDMTGLLAFVSGMEDGDSYLSSMAHLDCSKFDAALSQIDPTLSRLALTSEDYYKTFFEATVANAKELVVSVPVVSNSSGADKPRKADPSASGSPVGPLAGKVAVVTGASSGIGRAIVVSLVKAGCHVAMAARRLGELERTREIVAESCSGCASKTICVSTDVTRRESVGALIESTESSLGPVDILVNCAGCMYFTLMKNVMWDQWDAQVDVNAKGTMYGIGSVLPKMLERGTGHIVNITSDAGRKAFPGLGIYSGSKFFVEAVSQALRAETASSGLRVTCIQPGNVETPLLSKSTDPEGLKEYGTPTGAKVLEPSDIGRAVVYALTQPEWCAVNEILVEPREEPA